MSEKKEPAALSPAIKNKYRMRAGFAPGRYDFKGIQVDLTTITLEQADDLVKNKFDVIELIPDVKSNASAELKKPA